MEKRKGVHVCVCVCVCVRVLCIVCVREKVQWLLVTD